jgi:DNA-binding NtrC family response regulator
VRELQSLVYREALIGEEMVLRLGAPKSAAIMQQRRMPVGEWSFGELDATDFVTAKARAVECFERGYLSRLMERAGGNVSRAARMAGKERRTLGKLLKKHGLGNFGAQGMLGAKPAN